MRNNKGRILYSLLTISILPLLFSALLMFLLGYYFFTHTMYEEIYKSLQNTADYASSVIDTLYPGDYRLVNRSGLRIYKGDSDITESYELVDMLKESFGYEVTLFYDDTRILTTVYDAEGVRRVGTGAPEVVVEKVLYNGETYFYKNVIVNGPAYLICYTPLCNDNGHIVGMLSIGCPQSEIDHSIQSTVTPLLIVIILVMFTMTAGIFFYSRNLVSALLKIRNFLAETSDGNLTAELDKKVMTRNDEIGQIGQSILSMQRSMRNMVEQDTLTGLFNRRSANRKIANIMSKSLTSGTPFSIAIGDIDFFKKVNDTYGHDCGDIVLKTVSDTLREHMLTCGFVSRWGGEEFLLVFDHTGLKDTVASMNELIAKIRDIVISYDDYIIRLTMTFGVVEGENIPFKDLVCRADKLLYEGKHTGRDRIVAEEREDSLTALSDEPSSESDNGSLSDTSHENPADDAINEAAIEAAMKLLAEKEMEQ